VSPPEPVRTGSLAPSGQQGTPEEEILGGVFDADGPITPAEAVGMEVKLTQVDGDACVYHADTPGICRGSSSMSVLAGGSTGPLSAPIMFGWFNNFDETTNPCRDGASVIREVHDVNQDGVSDSLDGPVELHCATPGRYTITLSGGGITSRSRTIDHRKVRTPAFVEEKFIEDAAADPPTDTFVHFELEDSVTVGTNVLRTDDASTSEKFAPGDTVFAVGDSVRFESQAEPTNWTKDTRGPLLYRVWFDGTDPSFRSGYANPNRLIRSFVYAEDGPVETRAEIVTPADVDENTNRFSPQVGLVIEGPPPVATVDVSPSSATLTSQGETVELTATLRDADGNILTGRPIDWSSSNPTVATVADNEETAIVTAQSEGFATVTATSEGESDEASITVDFPPEPTTVVVSPSSASIEVGEEQQFSATVHDASGNRLFEAEQALAWTSSNSSVATMTDASGPVARALGQGGGTTTIRAEVEGVSDTASLEVTEPPPPFDDAAAISNSFPTQMTQGSFTAVSVTMRNTGTTTWSSGEGYDLLKVSGGFGFLPTTVGLGSIVVVPEETESIPFNLSTEASEGDHVVEYRMRHDAVQFGEANGGTITVVSGGCTKGCELAGVYEDAGPVPGGALDGGRTAMPAAADEVIQRLEVPNYRLRRVTSDGRAAAIEYYGALAEPWGVDVTFRLESDPGAVAPGVVRKSIELAGYEVEVESDGPGVTLVHLKRVREGAALPAGELLLLEIPLVSSSSERLPERLARVELIARQ